MATPAVGMTIAEWKSIFDNTADPQTKAIAQKVIDQLVEFHNEYLDISDDGKVNQSVPYVDEGYFSSDEDERPGSSGKTPYLDTLGNQFGIKDKILAMNGGDKGKAEDWLIRNGYDGHASGLAKDANGKEGVVHGSEFDDLYRKATGYDQPWGHANYIFAPGLPGSKSDGTTAAPPAPPPGGSGAPAAAPSGGSGATSQTPKLDSLGNQFGIKDKILAMNGGDKAKAEDWLIRNGYDGHASGLAKDDKGKEGIVQGSEFDDLYRKATGYDQPWGHANYIFGPGMPGSKSDGTTTAPPPGGSGAPAAAPSGGSGTTSQTPKLDSLGNQFGIKDKILAINGGDKGKAEDWLIKNGYDGHAGGLAKDSNGNEGIIYDSEFDKLYRKAFNTQEPWKLDTNYISGPNKDGTNSKPRQGAGTTTAPDPAPAPKKEEVPLVNANTKRPPGDTRTAKEIINGNPEIVAWLNKNPKGEDNAWRVDKAPNDPDGDNPVDWLLSQVGSNREDIYKNPDAAYRLEQVFKLADRDGDGKISGLSSSGQAFENTEAAFIQDFARRGWGHITTYTPPPPPPPKPTIPDWSATSSNDIAKFLHDNAGSMSEDDKRKALDELHSRMKARTAPAERVFSNYTTAVMNNNVGQMDVNWKLLDTYYT